MIIEIPHIILNTLTLIKCLPRSGFPSSGHQRSIYRSETTATTLRWALVLLVEYPDIQERLYKEIRNNIGTERRPSVQDGTALKYVEAFYMEVLRYVNGFLFIHKINQYDLKLL